MDAEKLNTILSETTRMFRKGDAVTAKRVSGLDVTEIFAMPHISEAPPSLEHVDVEFMIIGVDKQAAEKHRHGLLEWLRAYPQPGRLAVGPSYLEVGSLIGQDAALCLFALGQVLGLWQVMTPTRIGLGGEGAEELARDGMIYMTGFRSQ